MVPVERCMAPTGIPKPTASNSAPMPFATPSPATIPERRGDHADAQRLGHHAPSS